ncbi:peroxisome biogenesis factor 10-like isoform X2 [Mya arenaria]|nr:peroxisome biogenesis factor 10-like isoform X2 [Mya arenaria]XP_052790776.1 peroxisome biogenesis factor 10-like isoform X2 [Mya arenaria]
MFKAAGKAEIVRSHQKDEYYLTYLRNLTADVIHNTLGPRVWIAWRKEVDLLADLGYFLLTSFSGFQTIGEEYVNIVQVDPTRKRVPSQMRRGLMVLVHVLTPYLLRKLFDWLEKRLRSHDHQEVPLETREFLLQCIPVAQSVVLYTHRLHMAVFYLRGLFYHVAKRISGIEYLQYTGGVSRPPDESVTMTFRALGWITLAQLVGSGLLGAYRYAQEKARMGSNLAVEKTDGESVSGVVPSDRKCALCLEERKHSSVTPCGHLFCWSCIHDWCATKAECPLCREKFEQHRIVPLQNFDPP